MKNRDNSHIFNRFESYRQSESKALNALANQQCEEAIEIIEKAIREHPDIPEGYLIRAEAKALRVNGPEDKAFAEDAITDYSKALSLCPVHMPALAKRAKFLGKIKLQAEALADLKTRQKLASSQQACWLQFHTQLKLQIAQASPPSSANQALLNATTQDLSTNESLSQGAAQAYFLSQMQELEPPSYARYYLEKTWFIDGNNKQSKAIAVQRLFDPLPPQTKIQYLNQLKDSSCPAIVSLFLALNYAELDNYAMARKELKLFLQRMTSYEIDAYVLSFLPQIKKIEEAFTDTLTEIKNGERDFQAGNFKNAIQHYAIALLQAKQEAAVDPQKMSLYRQATWLHHSSAVRYLLQEKRFKEAKLYLDLARAFSEFQGHVFYSSLSKNCYQDGIKAMQKKNYNLAIDYFGVVIGLPATPEYYLNFSVAHERLGNHEYAIALAKHAKLSLGDEAHLPFTLSQSSSIPSDAKEEKNNADSVEFNALKKRFFSYLPEIDLSKVSLDAKRIEDERISQEKAAKQRQLFRSAMDESEALVKKHNFKLAQAALTKAQGLIPQCYSSYMFQAKMYAWKRDFDRAWTALENCQKLIPYSPAIYQEMYGFMRLAPYLASNTEVVRANEVKSAAINKAYLDAIVACYKKHENLERVNATNLQKMIDNSHDLLLGQLAFNSNNFEHALLLYSFQIDTHPEDYITLTERALVYLKLNQISLALKDVEKVLQLAHYPKANWLRAILHYKTGNSRQAALDMKLALERSHQSELDLYAQCKQAIFKILHLADDFNFHIDIDKKAEISESKRIESITQDPRLSRVYTTVGIISNPQGDNTRLYYARALNNLKEGEIYSAISDIYSAIQSNDKFHSCSEADITQYKTYFANECLSYWNESEFDTDESEQDVDLNKKKVLGLFAAALLFTEKADYERMLSLLEVELSGLIKFLKDQVNTFSINTPNIKLFFMRFIENFEDFHEHYVKSSTKEEKEKYHLDFLMAAGSGTYIPHDFREKSKKHKDKNPDKTPFVIHPPRKPRITLKRTFVADTDAKSEIKEEKVIKKPHKMIHQPKIPKVKKHEKRVANRKLYHSLIKEETSKPAYVPQELKFDFPSYGSQSFIDAKVEIPLHAVEKDILNKLSAYNEKIKKSDENFMPRRTYLLGGSVQNRFRHVLLKLTKPFDFSKSDFDISSEMNDEEIMQILAAYHPRKSPYRKNLFQIQIINGNEIIMVDIRCNQNLASLKEDARKRYKGYYYVSNDGIVNCPLGLGTVKDVLESRLSAQMPLDTVFKGKLEEGASYLSEDEILAPLRILLYVNASNKENLTLCPALLNQIKIDKSLIGREGIRPEDICAKLRKCFLNRNAYRNFVTLQDLGILDEIFPMLKATIASDADWLKVQMMATDRTQGYPSPYIVFASFVISHICQQMNLNNEPEPEMLRFKALTLSEAFIRNTPLFKAGFEKCQHIRSYLQTTLSLWINEHAPAPVFNIDNVVRSGSGNHPSPLIFS